MSFTNNVNLNGPLANQQTQNSSTSGTGATSLHPSTAAQISTPNLTSALPQDAFTPSSQTVSAASSAQAAGLLSPPKTSALPSSSTSIGAHVTNSTAEIAGPSNSSGSSQAGSNNSSASGGSDTGAQTAATAQGASTSSTAAAASTSATAGSGSTASASASGSVAQQTQLDSLNNALAALGLSAADIQQVDQVASLTNDYSPTAFTSLAYQLEAQAQIAATSNASSQNTQTPAAGASSTSAAATTTTSQSPSNGQTPSLHSTQQPAQTQTPAAGANSQAAAKTAAASA